jgi:hypothetical protein
MNVSIFEQFYLFFQVSHRHSGSSSSSGVSSTGPSGNCSANVTSGSDPLAALQSQQFAQVK